LNGDIPWKIPEDSHYFKELTRDKVIVLGSISFNETGDQSHLSHARWKILVSTTTQQKDVASTRTKIARSFAEAMDIAKQLEDIDGRESDSDIDCWVVGGERLFEEALRHPAIHEVRLTRVDVEVQPPEPGEGEQPGIARFPASYRWDYRFKETQRWEGKESGKDSSRGLHYTFHVYQCFRLR